MRRHQESTKNWPENKEEHGGVVSRNRVEIKASGKLSPRTVLNRGQVCPAWVLVPQHFWLSQLGECCWHLVGQGQGGSKHLIKPRTTLYNNYLASMLVVPKLGLRALEKEVTADERNSGSCSHTWSQCFLQRVLGWLTGCRRNGPPGAQPCVLSSPTSRGSAAYVTGRIPPLLAVRPQRATGIN